LRREVPSRQFGGDEDRAEAEAHHVTDYAGRLIAYDTRSTSSLTARLSPAGMVEVIRGNGVGRENCD
jgi:hypothetical protein